MYFRATKSIKSNEVNSYKRRELNNSYSTNIINSIPSDRDNPYFRVACKLFVELKRIGAFLQNYLEMHILRDASCHAPP